jgi:hypothetical protein
LRAAARTAPASPGDDAAAASQAGRLCRQAVEQSAKREQQILIGVKKAQGQPAIGRVMRDLSL